MRRKRDREARMWRQVADEQREAARRVAPLAASLATDGTVAPSVARTGHLTMRCATCGKVCYKDRESAEEAVAKIPDPMMAYESVRCGWWHLSTVRDGRKTLTTNEEG